MIQTFLYALIAVILVSCISFIGVFTLAAKKSTLNRWISFFVAFAAGTLLATAFFDLIPESFEHLHSLSFVLGGILLFYIFEALIHWHHNHASPTNCKACVKPAAYLNLLSDGIHNFVDGIIIAASFVAGIPTGIASSLAIALHEIPQEIADFSILVKSGFSVKRALLFNFLSASFAIFGMIIGYVALEAFEQITPYAIAIAAGGFIYIATVDLFPELHKEKSRKKVFFQILAVVAGILLIAIVLGSGHPHAH